MDEVIGPVLEYLARQDPGEVLGVYLYGSAVSGGLRPDSDVDLLMVTRRSLTSAEREALVSLLLSRSGWPGHADEFPEVAHRRPVELTSIVAWSGPSWRDRARRDFQYGEWLRTELVKGSVPESAEDADVITLIATAHDAHRVLRGSALADLVDPVPQEMLRRAVIAAVPDILGEAEADERNALLALSRILVTLQTGRIVTKDAAADAIIPTLAGTDRLLLERARDGYLGTAADDWSGLGAHVTSLAHALAQRAHRERAP